jgi:hypothetical protein
VARSGSARSTEKRCCSEQAIRFISGTCHLPANAGQDELEFEATLTPGLESSDMFAALYPIMRDYKGFAQFARVSVVMRRNVRCIRVAPPIAAIMAVVAGIARLFRMKAARPSAHPASGRVAVLE